MKRCHGCRLWVIKTLLAYENQAFGLRIAFDRIHG